MKNLLIFTILIIAFQIYSFFVGNQVLKAIVFMFYIFIIWSVCYLILGELKASVYASIGMLCFMGFLFVLLCLIKPDPTNVPPKVFLNKELIAKGGYHDGQSD